MCVIIMGILPTKKFVLMSNYYNESMCYACINCYYRSRECLKHFIALLTERKLLKSCVTRRRG